MILFNTEQDTAMLPCNNLSLVFLLVWQVMLPPFLTLADNNDSHDNNDSNDNNNGSYSKLNAMLRSKLGKDAYNPELRPLLNQSDQMVVHVIFALLSIVEVDDAKQKFSINGLMGMYWNDQLLKWNSTEYDGIDSVYPHPTAVWKPRMFMPNTLDKSLDPFEDRLSPLEVRNTGSVTWFAGGLFMETCKMDMTKFPFDQQQCELSFCSMNHKTKTLVFESFPGKVDKIFYTASELWDLVSSNVETFDSPKNTNKVSCVKVQFTIRRNPDFIVLNVILPVVVLSFLCNFIFLIPIKSGEQISYGITLLLAQALFLGTVNSMLPKSTTQIPKITVYIFTQLIFSTTNVLAIIIGVLLHWKNEEKEEHSLRICSDCWTTHSKLHLVDVAPSSNHPMTTNNNETGSGNDTEGRRRSHLVMTMDPKACKASQMENQSTKPYYHHICLGSKGSTKVVYFVIAFSLWTAVTVHYFISVMY